MTATNPFEKAIAADVRRREHDVTIDTRYGATSRECYCSATRGRSHHEDDTPWLSLAEEDALTPEERAAARERVRLLDYIEEMAYTLLALIPRVLCHEHNHGEPGHVHHHFDGHQRALSICIPTETTHSP